MAGGSGLSRAKWMSAKRSRSIVKDGAAAAEESVRSVVDDARARRREAHACDVRGGGRGGP